MSLPSLLRLFCKPGLPVNTTGEDILQHVLRSCKPRVIKKSVFLHFVYSSKKIRSVKIEINNSKRVFLVVVYTMLKAAYGTT